MSRLQKCFSVPDEHLGKKAHCPACHTSFVMASTEAMQAYLELDRPIRISNSGHRSRGGTSSLLATLFTIRESDRIRLLEGQATIAWTTLKTRPIDHRRSKTSAHQRSPSWTSRPYFHNAVTPEKRESRSPTALYLAALGPCYRSQVYK